MARLGARGRHNGANAVIHLAREVVGRRRTLANATQEVRNANILDALSDEDFRALDTTIGDRTSSDREFAQTLARLSYAAARAKGFDRSIVDAALRLDSLIPSDDPSHERDKLLRDAYHSAQKASYIRGGRLALGRLGRRAVEANDLERARVLLHQQLELGPEKDDTAAEVDSALVLGDILRHAEDDDAAQAWYRRAAASAERLDYRQGVAEALVRQIDATSPTNADNVVALQFQALDAAQRTGDRALEARIQVGLGDTLASENRLDDATQQYQSALTLARDTADLALEARCLSSLANAYRSQRRLIDTVETERAALSIEERLGNRLSAAGWALDLGMSELQLRRPDAALDAFERARNLGAELGDLDIQQRAEGGLGISSTLLRRGPETIDHLQRAIHLARQSHDHDREAQWSSSLGQAFWTFGHIEEATRTTNDAIALAEQHRNIPMQAQLYTLLGQIYAAQRETIHARDCYTRALQLNRDLHQTAGQVTTLTALGTLAADTGSFSQAAQLFEQALGLALADEDRSTAAVLHGRMGSLAQKRADNRLALDNFARATEIAQALDDPQLLARALQHLATAQDLAGEPEAMASYERAVNAADAASDIRGGISMRINMGILIANQSESGAASDAIGWLNDAASYALDAGPDFEPLRQQAESLIQSLGGFDRFADSYADDGGRAFDAPDDETDDLAYDGRDVSHDQIRRGAGPAVDRYAGDDQYTFADGYDDPGGADDWLPNSSENRSPAPAPYTGEPYASDPNDTESRYRPSTRNGRYAAGADAAGDALSDDDAADEEIPEANADRRAFGGRTASEDWFDPYDERAGTRSFDDRFGADPYDDRYGDRHPYAEDRYRNDPYDDGDYADDRYADAPMADARVRNDPYEDDRFESDRYDGDRYADNLSGAGQRYADDRDGDDGYADDRFIGARYANRPTQPVRPRRYDDDGQEADDDDDDRYPARSRNRRYEPNTVGGATDRYRTTRRQDDHEVAPGGPWDAHDIERHPTTSTRSDASSRDGVRRQRDRQSSDRRSPAAGNGRRRGDDPWHPAPRRRVRADDGQRRDMARQNPAQRFPRSRRAPIDLGTQEFDRIIPSVLDS